MSEKIYACLLRLFPSAFRRHYEEEALQLLRDRIRDERGFLPRLRLSLNLMVDLVGSLPQAYRNSYVEVVPDSSLSPQLEGAPSFRALQNEPIRPVAIAMGGLLSLTALATFTFLMGRSAPYRAAAPNEPRSPVESVIERVNQAISPDSSESGGPYSPETTSANTSGAAAEPSPQVNVVRSSRPRPAASSSGQPSQLREQNRSTTYPDPDSSPAVAVSSSLAQGQPATSQIATQSAASSNMQPPTHAAVVANLSGKWAGSFRAMSGDVDVPRWFLLKQDGARLTGGGGPDSLAQYPIVRGLAAGDSVKFEISNRKTIFLYDLKLEDKELRGTVSIKDANGTRTTEVRLVRAQ